MSTKVTPGNRYARLTVLADIGSRKWGQVVWLCQCDCGNNPKSSEVLPLFGVDNAALRCCVQKDGKITVSFSGCDQNKVVLKVRCSSCVGGTPKGSKRQASRVHTGAPGGSRGGCTSMSRDEEGGLETQVWRGPVCLSRKDIKGVIESLVGKPQHAELCLANPPRVGQQCFKDWLQLARRSGDYPQDV